MAKHRHNIDDKISFQLYLNDKRSVPSVSIYESGWERCGSGHNFGPVVREYYVFHLIVNGKGVYKVNGNVFELGVGDMFIINPGEEHQYTADVVEPWEYYWIGFHGSDAKMVLDEAGLTGLYKLKIKYFEKLYGIFKSIKEKEKSGSSSTFFLIAKFYEIMSVIALQHINVNDYQKTNGGIVPLTISYINSHYEQGLSVTKIADALNVNRSHLYRLFKAKMNISIIEYINQLRMTRALLLLKDKQYSIKQVCELAGYNDYPHFLKQFKLKYGITPKEYRKDPFETEHK